MREVYMRHILLALLYATLSSSLAARSISPQLLTAPDAARHHLNVADIGEPRSSTDLVDQEPDRFTDVDEFDYFYLVRLIPYVYQAI
jgi:hypothetical protein